nr:retrovirus-related Pol polyprotein from transposon TNT 1-94 [Tanacetum cinerariifolium]
MAKIQEVSPNPVVNSEPIFDAEPLHKDDTDELDQECDLFASLIEKLKCKIDDSKNRNKFLKTSNKALVDKLKGEIEDFKMKNNSLESSNNHFKEANNELSKTNQLIFKDLKKFQAKLDKYHDVNYASKVAIDCAKTKGCLMSYKMEFENSYNEYTQKINDLNQTISDMKKELFAHQETIFIIINADLEKFHLCLKEEMFADLRYFNSLEHEVHYLKSQLETKKTQFLNEIDRLSREYYYADHMNAILGVCTDMYVVSNLQYSLEKKDFLKSKSVTKNNVSNDFSKPVTAQILPQNVMSILKNTNAIAPGMYKVKTKPNQTRTPQFPLDIRKTNKRVSFSTRVIPTTSVSRPQFKSNQLEDRVMPNNAQGKKKEVEDHCRNFNFSNNKTSVTVCNDSLNAKTSNVNFVCVTCGKCVLNDNHDMYVLHFINGMNSRTKMPMAVPISTVKFRNGQIAPILGYGDLVQEKVTIKRVYYVEGLNYNILFVSKLCDADLEVAFQKSTCYIRNLKGNDFLTSSRGTDLYSITLQDTSTPNPICLMAKVTSSRAWLWYRPLSHLNFDTINLLSKNDIVIGVPKLKFVESINGKKYVLVIADDYSRYTSKDETPEVLIDFLRVVQRGLHAQVRIVQTDKDT